MPAQAELEAMFDADDAEVAAGRVVPAEQVKKAKAVLNRANERHSIIGRIVRGDRKVVYH